MMIKRYKQLCSKIFFGAAILMSTGNLFASDGQKIGDIYASASENAVERPLKSGPAIPDIARGYEDIWHRQLNFRLLE
jgi:hypothetical protein